MRIRIITAELLCIMMITALLCGCGKKEVPEKTAPEVTQEETTAPTDNAGSNKEEPVTEEPVAETPTDDECDDDEDFEIVIPDYITLDFTDVKEFHAEGKEVAPLTLEVTGIKDNGINFAEEWYESNGYSLPIIGSDYNQYYDDHYEYLWSKIDWTQSDLFVYDGETGYNIYVITVPTYNWNICVNNAYIIDGVLYGASILNGYAEPDSCFLFAYDLEKREFLWRSADQTCNSMDLVVIGDVIISGYGFTAEPDYLYQINRYTGEIIGKLELKKMADLMVLQDDTLYVHTYSYDYEIAVKQQ